MATVVNERDKILQAATSRYSNGAPSVIDTYFASVNVANGGSVAIPFTMARAGKISIIFSFTYINSGGTTPASKSFTVDVDSSNSQSGSFGSASGVDNLIYRTTLPPDFVILTTELPLAAGNHAINITLSCSSGTTHTVAAQIIRKYY